MMHQYFMIVIVVEVMDVFLYIKSAPNSKKITLIYFLQGVQRAQEKVQ